MTRSVKRYHPERYYMRGAGPKWLERYGNGSEPVGPVIDDYHGRIQLLRDFFFQFARPFWRCACQKILSPMSGSF